jgi:hypothetical protein
METKSDTNNREGGMEEKILNLYNQRTSYKARAVQITNEMFNSFVVVFYDGKRLYDYQLSTLMIRSIKENL